MRTRIMNQHIPAREVEPGDWIIWEGQARAVGITPGPDGVVVFQDNTLATWRQNQDVVRIRVAIEL